MRATRLLSSTSGTGGHTPAPALSSTSSYTRALDDRSLFPWSLMPHLLVFSSHLRDTKTLSQGLPCLPNQIHDFHPKPCSAEALWSNGILHRHPRRASERLKRQRHWLPSDDLSPVPRAHMAEGENRPYKLSSDLSHVPWHAQYM